MKEIKLTMSAVLKTFNFVLYRNKKFIIRLWKNCFSRLIYIFTEAILHLNKGRSCSGKSLKQDEFGSVSQNPPIEFLVSESSGLWGSVKYRFVFGLIPSFDELGKLLGPASFGIKFRTRTRIQKWPSS